MIDDLTRTSRQTGGRTLHGASRAKSPTWNGGHRTRNTQRLIVPEFLVMLMLVVTVAVGAAAGEPTLHHLAQAAIPSTWQKG
jgi:hypothetical protein